MSVSPQQPGHQPGQQVYMLLLILIHARLETKQNYANYTLAVYY